jgi:pre-rRNA-processing protein TSR3
LNIEHWILDIEIPMPPPVLILVRRGEDPRKCTVRPLRGTPGLDFLPYPLRLRPDLSRHLLLAPDAPPLSPADAGRPLLLLDASWRHAVKMRKAVEPVETRSIPPGWQSAYPRRSKIHEDPDTGLATVEALFAALCTLGFRNDALLRFYPWRNQFLELNSTQSQVDGWPCLTPSIVPL